MPEFGKFKDMRDGYVYRTVRIGNQTWFAENFRYECAGSFVHGNEKKNLKRYGRLYTWYSAVNAAPEGWRLPSTEDWNELTKYVGGEYVAGKVLKSRKGWSSKGNGTDEYGFAGLPGGYRRITGYVSGLGEYGHWWSSIEYPMSTQLAFFVILYANHDYTDRHQYGKENHLSVRYVKDRIAAQNLAVSY